MKKRIFSLLLALAVVFNFTTTSVFAAGGESIDADLIVDTKITTDGENAPYAAPTGTYWVKDWYDDLLTCEDEVHAHEGACYDVSACEHAHTDDCYPECDHECFFGWGGCLEFVCTNRNHGRWDHDDSCFRCTHDHEGCTLECTHTHEDKCYVYKCEHVNHAADSNCYVKDCKHTSHEDDCYGACDHEHYNYYGYSCYELDCTNPNHVFWWDHNESCYKCSHDHDDDCLECEHSCTIESKCIVLNCTHTHVDACKATICRKKEHAHNNNCYVKRWQWTLVWNTYTITWIDEDGTPLETDENVKHGTTPTYDGEEPSKEATKQYTYTFAGWEKVEDVVATSADVTTGVEAATDNVTYRATYSSTVNVYDVVWVDENGTTILEIDKNVEYGATPSFDGDEPTKAATETHTYTFDGWTPLIVTVEGDVVYKATYKEAIKKFVVTYIVDDEVIEAVEVEYGKDATAPEIPAKEGYTAKWDKDGKNITEDTEITAVYTAIPVEEPEAPTTGDTTNAGLYLVLMAAAALVLKKRGEQI